MACWLWLCCLPGNALDVLVVLVTLLLFALVALVVLVVLVCCSCCRSLTKLSFAIADDQWTRETTWQPRVGVRACSFFGSSNGDDGICRPISIDANGDDVESERSVKPGGYIASVVLLNRATF